MSSPIASTPGPEAHGAVPNAGVPGPSVLALSGLLKVQRRWSSASRAGGEPRSVEPERLGRTRMPVHLEDSEWTRLALGITGELLGSLGMTATAQVLELGPDHVTVHLPTAEPPRWPFGPGPTARSWILPRDSGIIGSLPFTPAITSGARSAALVTMFETGGRRALVNLVSVGSTILEGPPASVGVKIAEVAAELASRRWSDLGTLILVDLDQPAHRLAGAVYVADLAAALDELIVRSMNGMPSTSICVVVPPWASDTADPLLADLVHICETTEGAGVLCCASAEGALCLWELSPGPAGLPTLSFGDGRLISVLDLAESSSMQDAAAAPAAAEEPWPVTARGRGKEPVPVPVNPLTEVSVLGPVQVNDAAESFLHRRRLTELVAYIAMHPEGVTTDSIATALWPERRVPPQTLANRLSEARRALGRASDGRPRLRKKSRRHFIVEVETDWDRFRDLASEGSGADSWRRALGLVRGRPFDALDRGEWAHLEGYGAAIEASVIGVACRLGEYSIGRGRPELAHWAALQGLLVSPWDERLYRLLMRAADGLGNRGGIDEALRNLARALELEGDPLLGIHPETSSLYRSLISGDRPPRDTRWPAFDAEEHREHRRIDW